MLRADLKELIFLLQEQYIGTMVRCKKARAMFASRACRKSVMFGHALNTKQMESVTRHMGEIEHPWVSVTRTDCQGSRLTDVRRMHRTALMVAPPCVIW